MSLRTAALGVLLCVVIATGWFFHLYTAANLETANLDDDARRSVGGTFTRTSDGMVRYELSGPETGAPVVLVHGFSVPYYLWDPTFRALIAAGYRVLRYDLFGRGFSDRPDARYDGAFFDRQLIELLDALGITSPVHIVGSSMGGPIAAGFVCRHPGRAASLSLFDPGFSHGQRLPWNLRMPLIGEYNFATKVVPNLAQGQLADFSHPERFPDWPARYRPQMRYRGFRRALLATLRNYLAEDWSREFVCAGRTNLPVFLVWGRNDRDVPFETSQQVLATMPQAQFLPVDDAAHVPFLEYPKITDAGLLNFLASIKVPLSPSK